MGNISWSTADEKKFLWNIGRYSKDGQAGLVSRLDFLLGYLASIPKRAYWGTLNKAEIEEYTRSLIAAELSKAA